MAGLKSVELEIEGTKDLALITTSDEVWLVVNLHWWDLATLIWWVFVPMDKKSRVKLTLGDGKKVSFRAVRVATRHVRIRDFKAA
jgi:hypothetical protein